MSRSKTLNPGDVLDFGLYKGLPVDIVAKDHPEYLDWLCNVDIIDEATLARFTRPFSQTPSSTNNATDHL